MTLRQLIYKTFFEGPYHKCRWIYSENLADFTDYQRFYVHELDPKEVKPYERDIGGENYGVVASSEFPDGFCSDVSACRIGDFYVAIFDERRADHKKWRLKMHQHGWEQIPPKYYEMEVEEPS